MSCSGSLGDDEKDPDPSDDFVDDIFSFLDFRPEDVDELITRVDAEIEREKRHSNVAYRPASESNPGGHRSGNDGAENAPLGGSEASRRVLVSGEEPFTRLGEYHNGVELSRQVGEHAIDIHVTGEEASAGIAVYDGDIAISGEDASRGITGNGGDLTISSGGDVVYGGDLTISSVGATACVGDLSVSSGAVAINGVDRAVSGVESASFIPISALNRDVATRSSGKKPATTSVSDATDESSYESTGSDRSEVGSSRRRSRSKVKKRLLSVLCGVPAASRRHRRRQKSGHTHGKCLHCETTTSPQWRQGPMGPRTLCNACGVRYSSGRLLPEYRPLASPSFACDLHSNCHRKVMQIRRKTMKDGANAGDDRSPSSPPS